MKIKIIVSLALLFGVFQLRAQEWELGLSLGPTQYQGDLSKKQLTLPSTRIGGGALIRRTLNPFFAIRGEVNLMYIEGSDQFYSTGNNFDAERWKRNTSFFSNIFEISSSAELNFRRYIPGSKSYKFTPYVSAGVGVFHFNPKTTLGGRVYTLQPLPTEDKKPAYSLFQPCFPIGFGFKWNVGGNWTFGANIATRILLTDYLDDVSNKWADYNSVAIARGNDVALLGDRSRELDPSFNYQKANDPNRTINRGNPNDKDTYIFMGFMITKTFRKFSCMGF